jgi:AraC-like DNA-binding protein
MQKHLSRKLSLDQLSALTGLSKFHLIRVFKSETGIAPHTFLSAIRIQEAKRLLKETEKSVIEICLDVGYESATTFSYHFNAAVGLPPTEYRSRSRESTPREFLESALQYIEGAQALHGRTVTVDVVGDDLVDHAIFVGAFAKPIPIGRPISGGLLLSPGQIRLQRPTEARTWWLLAAAIPLTVPPYEADVCKVGVSRILASHSHNELALRPLSATDPPLVLAVPALLPKTEINKRTQTHELATIFAS